MNNQKTITRIKKYIVIIFSFALLSSLYKCIDLLCTSKDFEFMLNIKTLLLLSPLIVHPIAFYIIFRDRLKLIESASIIKTYLKLFGITLMTTSFSSPCVILLEKPLNNSDPFMYKSGMYEVTILMLVMFGIGLLMFYDFFKIERRSKSFLKFISGEPEQKT